MKFGPIEKGIPLISRKNETGCYTKVLTKMNVGDSVFIEPEDGEDLYDVDRKVRSGVAVWKRRHYGNFTTRIQNVNPPFGVRVWRTA